MQYVTKRVGNYEAHIFPQNNTEYLALQLKYVIDFNKYNKTISNLLCRYLELARKTEVVQKFKEFIDEFYLVCIDRVQDGNLEIDFNIIWDKKANFKDILNFSKDMITLHTENNKLDEAKFKKAKKCLISSLNINLELDKKREDSLIEFLFPGSILTESLFKTEAELKGYLEEIKEEDLIKMYYNIFQKSFVGAVFVGDIDDEELLCLEKTFVFPSVKEYTKNITEIFIDSSEPNYIAVVKNEKPCKAYMTVVFSCPTDSLYDKALFLIVSELLKVNESVEAIYIDWLNAMFVSVVVPNGDEFSATKIVDDAFNNLTNETVIKSGLKKLQSNTEKEIEKIKKFPILLLMKAVKEVYNQNMVYKERDDLISFIKCDEIKNALKKLKSKKVHYYEE